MNYFLQALKRYGDFRSRSRRKEYWMFALFQIIVLIAAMLLDNLLGTAVAPMPYGYIYLLASVVLLLPSLAVTVRRLHDVNKSGWFLLIGIIPLIGAIWLLVLFCTEGTRGENKYGADPKASENLAYQA
jgi:uncharacterized membrane protein YhaH (DUF805 family)